MKVTCQHAGCLAVSYSHGERVLDGSEAWHLRPADFRPSEPIPTTR